MLVLAAVIAAAAVATLVMWWWTHRHVDRIVASQVRRRAVVTTKSGPSFIGVLVDADERAVVLAQPESVEEQAPLDGELLILRVDVAFIQLL